MKIFMNNNEIKDKIKSCLKDKTTRESDEEYNFLLNLLLGIDMSGEVKDEAVQLQLNKAIKSVKRHTNLAIIKDGRVCRIDSYIAARHNVTSKSNACSGMFPVMDADIAETFLDFGGQLARGIYDSVTKSVVTESLFYKLHPEQVVFLNDEEIKRLGIKC